MVEFDPYEIHEAIENRVLSIASKYAKNGSIDLERCVIKTFEGEEVWLSQQDCEELRRLYELDKRLGKIHKGGQ